MRIAFLGDASHPNAQSWLAAVQDTVPCAIVTWSLPNGKGRGGRLVRILAWLEAAMRIRRMVSGWSPDLLIAHRTTSYGFLAALSGFHPLVVAAQGETDAWPVDSLSVGLKRRMARKCLKSADLIHAWGDHIAQEQLALGAAREKILVRPRGVDLDKFFPPSAGPNLDALQLVSTRSLFPEYRHDIILDAVASVARKGVPISFDIVGDGVSVHDLKSQALRLGLSDRVRFHGRVSHDQLPELLRRCNIYVGMPVTEGVSASLLEAMACGCYPIVTDLVANRYWISQHENGTLVPVDDTAALEKALLAVWENKSLIARAAEQNRLLIREKASLKDNIACFVRNYKRLVANVPSRRC